MVKKIKKLRRISKSLLPEVKYWNRQRLFLAWAFAAAIIVSVGLEIVKFFNKDNSKSYLTALIITFIFGLFIIFTLNKVIDTRANDVNKTYSASNAEIKKLRKRTK